MIKILAIGNSFSQDATARLHDLAAAGGLDVMTGNLYIGGCSLQTHAENDSADRPNYEYFVNGASTGRMISIRTGLQEERWDYVTLQQASHDSGCLETYYPYVRQLSATVSRLAPQAEQLIHQTWAYETDSSHGAFPRYGCSQQAMYDNLDQAYRSVAADLGLRLIPCGQVIQAIRQQPLFDYARGGQSICRDGFHLHLAYGRFAAAATWLEFILGQTVLGNPYRPEAADDAEPIDDEKLHVIRETVHRVVRGV